MNKNEVCAGLTRTKTRFVPVEKRGFCRFLEGKNEVSAGWSGQKRKTR
jgi:hypothetical protein